jgi:4-amino-4-deoxy-L-arabinose transferase-like glycosyltransferase
LFNITHRLGRESVGEWDESLYATTAFEMSQSGDLIGTTFDGALDYYNTKPPLNVWTIAASYRLFGVNLWSLRLPSALAALITVGVFLWWTQRLFGARVSLLATTVLGTSFGYLHIHSARSANPDALLTLANVLVVVVLSAASAAPWRRVWLGPLLSAVFLLKGMAVLQPVLLIVLFETFAGGSLRSRWRALALAALTVTAVAGTWALLRWRVDGWAFLSSLISNDLFALSLSQVERHNTRFFFYFGVMQRYQYDWLIAAMVALGLGFHSFVGVLTQFRISIRERRPLSVLLVAWTIATLVLPSAMQTRLAWYLNPFYPLFALLVSVAIVHAVSALSRSRRRMLIVVAVAALASAEGRSLWRIYKVTNLDTSVQGLLMDVVQPRSGQRVYRDRISRAEAFVVRAILGGEFLVGPGIAVRPAGARSGDLVVVGVQGGIPGLTLMAVRDGHSIHVVD